MSDALLFVDDDDDVLEGIELRLRQHAKHWDLDFANSGQQALEKLENHPYSAIITDVQMPGLDGISLLREIKEHYPGVARIVLTGQVDRSTLFRIISVSHQFLNKPCRPDELERIIARALRIRDLINDSQIRGALGNVSNLPSLPSLYTELQQKLGDDNTTLSDIATLIARDMSMTSRVLQVVNSAAFGLRRQITSVVEAVSYLGATTTSNLVLAAGLFSAFESKLEHAFSLEELQKHSLDVAMLAKQIAQSQPEINIDADNLFTACFLHDVGKLIMAAQLPRQFDNIVDDNARFIPVDEEIDKNGFSHAEVGAFVLGQWGLPHSIVEAVAYHHHPAATNPTELDVVGIVHIAEQLREEHDNGNAARFDTDYLDSLALHARINDWRELTQSSRGDE